MMISIEQCTYNSLDFNLFKELLVLPLIIYSKTTLVNKVDNLIASQLKPFNESIGQVCILCYS